MPKMHSNWSILRSNIVVSSNKNLHSWTRKYIVQIFKNTEHVIDETLLIWKLYFYDSNRGHSDLKVSDSNIYNIIDIAN